MAVGALTLVASSVAVLHTAEDVQAAGVIHVDPAGSDDATGTASAPVRTLARAVKLASDGDRIVLASGTYHEQVQVYGKAVHLAAAAGATVVLDGAVAVTEWTADGGQWSASWSTAFARAGEPHTLPEVPEAGWPEQFFLDGTQLTEVTSRSAVGPGTFYYDVAASSVWIADDPYGRLVEGSDLAWGLYLNHADGSTIERITARRYATPYTNMAAIRAYADDLVLRDVVVEDNAYMGVSAIGNNISFQRLTARRNGHLGAHAHRSTGISITDSTIVDNNAHVFNFHHAAGGFKVTNSTGIVVTDSTVSGNGGPAIWTDLSTSDIVVARNLVQGNSRHGIMIELSTAATIVDNVTTGNERTGIWVLESSDVRVWHNASFDNFRDLWILDGPRSDVFDVEVVNNTFGGGSAGAQSVISVDDWTKDRSTAEMNISMAGNRYWLPDGSPTPYISRFAHWPADLSLAATIEEHHAAAGLDTDSDLDRGPANPFVRDVNGGDHRQPAGAPLGHSLPAAVAAAAGVPTGSAHPAGPLSASDTHGIEPAPASTPTPVTAPATTAPASTIPTIPTIPTMAPASTAPTAPGTTTTGTTTPSASVLAGVSARSSTALPAVRMRIPVEPSRTNVGARLAAAAAAPPASNTDPTAAAPQHTATFERQVGWHELAVAVTGN